MWSVNVGIRSAVLSGFENIDNYSRWNIGSMICIEMGIRELPAGRPSIPLSIDVDSEGQTQQPFKADKSVLFLKRSDRFAKISCTHTF